ncbi:Gfo/Idh/MocA family protein [Bacillus marinisedimentorum]|uniref:Gfo/Idh/MocA family protein n=1 Tax=Bacillus marinisedimentorum TaxID=1821260 RepID=UPI0007E1E19E|nr:Gfo/Idh/MocA family oxidoreductase [Bacillus marinisedimentorum]
MKVGIIGLGHIAQKAYLPLLAATPGIDLVLATRNKTTLQKLSSKYRISETASSIGELAQKNIEAAFVHSATEVHPEMVDELLRHNIHVFVDKPLSLNYEEAEKLTRLADRRNLILMTGFNRRFAPMYRQMKEVKDRQLIVMQKNRFHLPGDIRHFIFNDYIHVVDTLRFLIPGSIGDMHVHGIIKKGLLHQAVLQLSGSGFTAIGIMNRDSGITEEKLEVSGPGVKRAVKELTDGSYFHDETEEALKFGGWDSTLYKRGFVDMIAEFLNAAATGNIPSPSAFDSLQTHELCEKITRRLEGQLNP